jgi:hypothetical protein
VVRATPDNVPEGPVSPYLILGYSVAALATVAAILCGWPF